MKLKQSPDDFVVEEQTEVVPTAQGDYAFYRLDKVGWTTVDALQAVRTRWNLDTRRLSFGGLKDRHARTSQYFTIFGGPRRNLTHDRIKVIYLGQVKAPYTSVDIRSNAFTVTLRAITVTSKPVIVAAIREVDRVGVPNYFDDQRFGSVGDGSAFVAREMVFGRFEEALRLALTLPYEHDRGAQKREKEILRRFWGDWPACRTKLPSGHARRSVEYLVHNSTDYRGAVARLRPELQGLYLSAYQSYLWNRILAQWLMNHFPTNRLVTVRNKLEELPAPNDLPGDLQNPWESLSVPFPSARLKLDPGSEWYPIMEKVLGEEQLTLSGMKIPGLRKPFFSKGERAGSIRPTEFMSEFGPDEKQPGQEKLLLKFKLPRGSYATVLVKRITAATPGWHPSQ